MGAMRKEVNKPIGKQCFLVFQLFFRASDTNMFWSGQRKLWAVSPLGQKGSQCRCSSTKNVQVKRLPHYATAKRENAASQSKV